jgi:hypothetical protein
VPVRKRNDGRHRSGRPSKRVWVPASRLLTGDAIQVGSSPVGKPNSCSIHYLSDHRRIGVGLENRLGRERHLWYLSVLIDVNLRDRKQCSSTLLTLVLPPVNKLALLVSEMRVVAMARVANPPVVIPSL